MELPLFAEPIAKKPRRLRGDRKAQDRAYYLKNRERISAQCKEYRNGSGREERLAQKRARYAANKAEILAKQRAAYQGNKAHYCAKMKAYREANPEIVRERKKDYCRRNKEKVAAKKRKEYLAKRDVILKRIRGCPKRAADIRRWRSENRAYVAAYAVAYQTDKAEAYKAAREAYRWSHRAEKVFAERKRRQRKLQSGGYHTLEQWIAKCEEFNFSCAYCGMRGQRLTEDHDIPLSRGGSDDIDNIVPACTPCNAQKNARTGEEYRIWLDSEVGRARDTYNSGAFEQRRKPDKGPNLQS